MTEVTRLTSLDDVAKIAGNFRWWPYELSEAGIGTADDTPNDSCRNQRSGKVPGAQMNGPPVIRSEIRDCE